ncbi:hypothetical protein OG21DRAFT_355457 [Imleria badia]|nr:hypothetical protein OG21DRAFT_355457 [Imleria badia]
MHTGHSLIYDDAPTRATARPISRSSEGKSKLIVIHSRSLPDPVNKKSLKLVIARTSILRSVSCVRVPTCGNSTFCGNASSRGFTRGSSGYTSKPTDANYHNVSLGAANTTKRGGRTCPSSSARITASSSTTLPRAVFTSTLPRFITLTSRSPTIPLVSSRSARPPLCTAPRGSPHRHTIPGRRSGGADCSRARASERRGRGGRGASRSRRVRGCRGCGWRGRASPRTKSGSSRCQPATSVRRWKSGGGRRGRGRGRSWRWLHRLRQRCWRRGCLAWRAMRRDKTGMGCAPFSLQACTSTRSYPAPLCAIHCTLGGSPPTSSRSKIPIRAVETLRR